MAMPTGMELATLLAVGVLLFGGQIVGVVLTFFRKYDSISQRLLWVLLMVVTGWIGVIIFLLKGRRVKSSFKTTTGILLMTLSLCVLGACSGARRMNKLECDNLHLGIVEKSEFSSRFIRINQAPDGALFIMPKIQGNEITTATVIPDPHELVTYAGWGDGIVVPNELHGIFRIIVVYDEGARVMGEIDL